MKICIRCKQLKSLSSFTINNSKDDGKHYYCKKCMIKIRRKAYAIRVNKNVDELVKRVEVIDGKKRCCCCKKWKAVKCFSKVSTISFKCGYYSSCKECDGLRYSIKSRIRKMEFMEAYGIVGCTCCGETELDLLTIEHIRGNGYDLIYDDVRVLFDKLKRLGYPKGYTLLCYNCNLCTKHGRPCVHTKEYRMYENKLESVLVNDKRLDRYNELVIDLNKRRTSYGVH